MAYETILTEIREQIGFLTLNRPDKLNTFNRKLARELNDALREMDADDRVRVVIIKGAGKAFSTGIDISEYPGQTPQEYHAWSELMDEMHHTIAAMSKPVIAMVHGYAIANGAGLMYACDLAVVAEGTKIGTTAINVGLLCTGPLVPATYCLSKAKIMEMMLSGEMIDAAEAYRLGLINKVVPLEKLEEETLALAQKIISKSPLAVKLGKRYYYEVINMPFRQRFTYSNEVFARLCTSEDAKEGVDAFLTKRKPVWQGK